MVIAKILFGQDNKSFMHDQYPYCCPTCHYATRQKVNTELKLKKRNYDVSYTYDGYLIVSERFRSFCETKAYKTLNFHALNLEPDFFFLEVLDFFSLDYARRDVQFIDLCNDCKRYAAVIGATPSYIEEGFKFRENVFYKSSFDFGSYNRKSPLIIVGLTMADELLQEKFKGLYFKDVLE
ncbi:MAG: hypothetical protein ACK5JD_04315 [Mangrovibacterium sp.]